MLHEWNIWQQDAYKVEKCQTYQSYITIHHIIVWGAPRCTEHSIFGKVRVIYNAEMKILFKVNLTFECNQMKVDKMKYASDGSYRKLFFTSHQFTHYIVTLHYSRRYASDGSYQKVFFTFRNCWDPIQRSLVSKGSGYTKKRD